MPIQPGATAQRRSLRRSPVAGIERQIMVLKRTPSLPDLYEADETAWLETMARLIAAGRRDELDYTHLQEYLSDMANRDRRTVESRLTILMTHLLKCQFQPEKRTR